jgi:hypothetical protein
MLCLKAIIVTYKHGNICVIFILKYIFYFLAFMQLPYQEVEKNIQFCLLFLCSFFFIIYVIRGLSSDGFLCVVYNIVDFIACLF